MTCQGAKVLGCHIGQGVLCQVCKRSGLANAVDQCSQFEGSSLHNHSAHSKGTYVIILRCFIISSENFHMFLNENWPFKVFDLTRIVFDLTAFFDLNGVFM